MNAYRARAVLSEAGIGLAELVRHCGRSKTTWSRFLAGGRAPARGDAKRQVEQVLHAKGMRVPPDLWRRERKVLKAPRACARATMQPPRQAELNMQAQALSQAARQQWKLFTSPFEPEAMLEREGEDRLGDLYLSLPHQFVLARLVQAYTKAGFVAVAGEPGSGKSTLNQRAFRDANEDYPVVLVTPPNIERRKMTAMHVSAEIIRQLSNDTLPRTANVRDAMAAKILRQRYENGERVALLIDEAHELPENTIKDLKRYHEMSHGFARLLAIVLIGQTELAARFDDKANFRLREVIIRCQLIKLAPMAGDGEVAAYLEKRFSWVGADVHRVFHAKAIAELAQRLGVHSQQYPVLIGNAAVAAMNIAARRGNELVQAGDVEEVWAATPDQLSQMGL